MKKVKIEVTIVMGEDTKIFLTATDDIGKAILADMTNGEYIIHGVTGSYQLGQRSLQEAVVIEKKPKTEEQN